MDEDAVIEHLASDCVGSLSPHTDKGVDVNDPSGDSPLLVKGVDMYDPFRDLFSLSRGVEAPEHSWNPRATVFSEECDSGGCALDSVCRLHPAQHVLEPVGSLVRPFVSGGFSGAQRRGRLDGGGVH